MKSYLRFALLIAVLLPCIMAMAADTKPATEAKPGESKSLQGTWMATSIEVNGNKVSEDVMKEAGEQRLVFEDGKGTIKKGSELLGEFTYKVDAEKSPKTLDISLNKGSGDFKQYEGKKSRAIYEVKGDSMKVCWTFFESDRTRPTEFATSADSNLLLVTYKREKK